jgi:hypothetical protein
MDVFSTDLCDDGKALAVFSFQEEAQMFLGLRLAVSREGWRVRQTSMGELVSVLYGPCLDTKKVVLNPVPEVGRKKLVGLLSMHRHDFLRFRFAEEGPSDLHVVPPRTSRPQKRVKHESTSHNLICNGDDDVVVERPLPKAASNSTATRKPTR